MYFIIAGIFTRKNSGKIFMYLHNHGLVILNFIWNSIFQNIRTFERNGNVRLISFSLNSYSANRKTFPNIIDPLHLCIIIDSAIFYIWLAFKETWSFFSSLNGKVVRIREYLYYIEKVENKNSSKMKCEKEIYKQDRFTTTILIAFIKCRTAVLEKPKGKRIYWSFWETELFCFEVFKASKVFTVLLLFFVCECWPKKKKLKIWKLIRKTPISGIEKKAFHNIFSVAVQPFRIGSLFSISSFVSFGFK